MTIRIDFKDGTDVRLEEVNYFCYTENEIFLQVVFINGKTNYYKPHDIKVIQEL